MLNKIIAELVDEKGLNQSELHNVIQEGLLAAYTKKYPDVTLRVTVNDKDETLLIESQKEVVSKIEDPYQQISLKKAQYIKKNIKIGDKLWLPFEEPIGRVEILKARQIIATMLKDIEARGIYEAFKDKQGSIVQGVVHKHEQSGTLVMLQDTLAFLPRSLSIPGEKYIAGRPVRALLKEVHQEHRSNGQLILDRSSGAFLKSLLELEIPEVYDNLIEIKAVARRAGYKSKVIVAQNDPNIDPVGTCIGVGGSRIKPILKELGGEKIDVFSWSNSRDELVALALRPAEVNKVEIVDEKKARAWVSEDQRALAIGKMGQNIGLASELLDTEIELVSSGEGVNLEIDDSQSS
ncbi:MAG: transcription termination factor NusA [Epsilonproteobacteria bacterium]|nr:transcription termination factor NusA [Campylobacterota bacterium]|tara:strand:+ start:5964 stop:7013 length:1050 start_codon:yes stop_codon:yes gene_type:complete